MAKFKFRLKITGFEVDVEGDRTDLPAITNNVGQQLSRLLEPTAKIIDAQAHPQSSQLSLIEADTSPAIVPKRRSKSRARPETGLVAAVDWKHDPARWGMPVQTWPTAKKSLWLLYVVAEAASQTELSSQDISVTFNKHFRQSGMIQTSKVTRDLGRLKSSAPSPVGEDTRVAPTKWFLTDSGRQQAQALVAEALGQSGT